MNSEHADFQKQRPIVTAIVTGSDGCDGYLGFTNSPHELVAKVLGLRATHPQKASEERARGLAQLNLNTARVRSFRFGLPPLAEQKRVIAEVDELIAVCDQLEVQPAGARKKHAALARASLAPFRPGTRLIQAQPPLPPVPLSRVPDYAESSAMIFTIGGNWSRFVFANSA